jgi:trigger factor
MRPGRRDDHAKAHDPMNVTETVNAGLKREYTITLPATDLEKRLSSELETYRGKVRINGFRPGKVPTAHLRRLYGRSIMAEVVQNAVTEANNKIVADGGFKLAMQPRISFPDDQATIEKVMDAKADLDVTVALEVLPTFSIVDHSDIALERPVAEISDAEIEQRVLDLAKGNAGFSQKDGPAADGDRLTIDFVGTLDGTPFDGGTAEDAELVIGSGRFIPGFEEQLTGAAAGETRTVSVTFPADYQAAHLAGKDAVFAVRVKAVAAPNEPVVDEALAKSFGLDSVDALRARMREFAERETRSLSHRKVKRKLLDALDGKYQFEVPQGLLDQEFEGIWRQVENEMRSTGKTFEDENTTEEAARAEYRAIAARRVRLGLVLAEIGERAKVEISDEEVSRALIARAQQFPGQERQVVEFYRKNPEQLASLRAPIFEDKVVHHLLAEVKVTDVPVSREALEADDEDDASA